MGLGALGELQMRNRGANGRPHTRFLFPVPPSKRDTWFGGSRWWHCVNWLQTTEFCIWWINRPKRRRRIMLGWDERTNVVAFMGEGDIKTNRPW